jgi:FkbM family methyltransferase
MVPTRVNGGYDIVLPKHRAERPEWYTAEGWEKARTTAMVSRIHDLSETSVLRNFGGQAVRTKGTRPVVYYVGAEEGDLAAICALAGARMFLFEPNPKAWPNIKAIWDANDLEMPVCFAGFASNVTDGGGAQPCRCWPDVATGEIIGDHGFKELYLEAANYPQIRLDTVAENCEPPDIISFDVEGSEWQVLRGAEHILRQFRPTLFASIHPEFMFHQWGEYSRDFRNWIKDLGYRETILDYAHELHTMYEAI